MLMKNYLLIVVALVLNLNTLQAQHLTYTFDDKATEAYADQVRIHLTVNSFGLLKYRLHSNLQEEPIKIQNNNYALIVTDKEDIAFFQNIAVNNLPVQLSFERGKDYYFRFRNGGAQGMMNLFLVVDELTKREFQMHLFANHIVPKPIVHDLTESTTQIEQ